MTDGYGTLCAVVAATDERLLWHCVDVHGWRAGTSEGGDRLTREFEMQWNAARVAEKVATAVLCFTLVYSMVNLWRSLGRVA